MQIAGIAVLLIFMFLGDLSVDNYLCGLFVFSFFLILYKFKLVAAGDVKFSFLIGCFFGFSLWMFLAFFVANIFSLMHGLVFIFRDKFEFINYRFISSEEDDFFFKKIPYAGYLSISTVLCMLYMPKP